MNRSNTSANKDIGHIVKDMLRLLTAYGVAVLFMGRAWSLRTLGGMTGLAAIFVLLYVLGKEEQYLYNVTLFGYPDRIQRRRTGSFLVATAATVVLLPYITEDQRGYFLFLILAYSLESDTVKAADYAPFLEAIKTAKSRPTVACWSEMDSELSVAVTDVMNGKKTAQEAMDKLAERFDELLAE